MNILLLCDEYPPANHGGIGSVTKNLAEQFVRDGHRVIVTGLYPYFRHAKSHEEVGGVTIFRNHYGSRLSFLAAKVNFLSPLTGINKVFFAYQKHIKNLIAEFRIDLIEIPDFNEVFLYSGDVFTMFENFDIPLIVRSHGTYSFLSSQSIGRKFNQKIFYKEKKLLETANGIIAVSQYSAKYLEKTFVEGSKITTIYNAVNISHEFEYQGDTGKPFVVFAGKLNRNKGLDLLLDAWEIVRSILPSLRLVLCGNFTNENRSEYEERIKSSDIEHKGFLSKASLQQLYEKSSCAVFPSISENFSMAPLEAMSIGCPVICSSLTSGPELIEHGVNGLLIDPRDREKFANLIVELVTNREFAVQIGARGKKTILERFDIGKTSVINATYYQSIIDDFRNHQP